MKVFKFDERVLDISTKCAYVNLLISADKCIASYSNSDQNRYNVLTSGVMKTIYYSVMLNNLSLFFYKCVDPIYVLEFYAYKVSKEQKEIN